MKKIFGLLMILFAATVFFISCNKEYSNESGGIPIAKGTLKDTSGNCLPDSVYGTFYDGVQPGGDTAYVAVQVNVTATGSYSITSDFQNGLEFADSGIFTTLGINTIKLKPVGTPILLKNTTYLFTFDSSSCTFTINFKDSTGAGVSTGNDTTGSTGGSGDPDAGGTSWSYKQGSAFYSGEFDSTVETIISNAGVSATDVVMTGSSSTDDTTFSLELLLNSAGIQPGTYTNSNSVIIFSSGDFLNDFSYTANAGETGTSLTVVITSYNATTKTIEGTFSGNVQNNAGSIVPITGGIFTAVVK